jgi:hypothetical protein
MRFVLKVPLACENFIFREVKNTAVIASQVYANLPAANHERQPRRIGEAMAGDGRTCAVSDTSRWLNSGFSPELRLWRNSKKDVRDWNLMKILVLRANQSKFAVLI